MEHYNALPRQHHSINLCRYFKVIQEKKSFFQRRMLYDLFVLQLFCFAFNLTLDKFLFLSFQLYFSIVWLALNVI